MEQERIRQELRQITEVVEQLTGLRSRWSGVIELVPDANFKGKKPFTCEILIDAALVATDLRWRTLIHEALHAVSAGYIQSDFMANRGWEEGVVEKLQRVIRRSVLIRLSIMIEDSLFFEVEDDHAFNLYIEALEKIRLSIEVDEMPFYLGLLRTPIKSRYSSLVAQSMLMPIAKRNVILEILSVSNVILTRRP